MGAAVAAPAMTRDCARRRRCPARSPPAPYGPSLTPLPRCQAKPAGTDGADGDLAGHAGGCARRRARRQRRRSLPARPRRGGSMNAAAGTGAAAGHAPVMLDRVRALLRPALESDGAVLIDATLGRAGHARMLLADHPRLTLIGIDADQVAIEESARLLADDNRRVLLVHAAYDQIPRMLSDLG